MPICYPAQFMSLWSTIQVIINEKRASNALGASPQWQWRGFDRHRSAKGADGSWSDCAGHKGALVSRRHFILVHSPTPAGQPGLRLPGDLSQITVIALTHRLPPETLWNGDIDKHTLWHAMNTLTGMCSHHLKGSKSMVNRLQWEEQENRLKTKKKNRMELHNIVC